MDLNQYIDFLAANAEAAMLKEVHAAPKPGLVDRLNSGSHQDMDYETFQRSAKALTPHFRYFMEQSAASKDDRILPDLRALGIKAENDMYLATNGAKTHKGLIFSLGLMAACLVRLALKLGFKPARKDLPGLRELIRMNAQGITGELKDASCRSHGQTVFLEHGLMGVRQEAEEGFPAVFLTGLPALQRYRSIYVQEDLPVLLTLLELILVTDDTTLVKRGGLEGLHWMRQRSESILDQHEMWSTRQVMDEFSRFDLAAQLKALSPGGAADNLALTLFLDMVLN